jgi:hypothetical protein
VTESLIPPEDLAIAFCIEGTPIEEQALLLSESIRRFAGAYAGVPIVAVNPRAEFPISRSAERALEKLGVRYVSLPLNRTASPYLPINRIVTGSWAEANLEAAYVMLLDSDMLFVREPAFRRAGAGVRPVDAKGSASSGDDDAIDPYWREMCEIGGVAVERLPFLETSVDGSRIRASYNGGFCIVRRSLGILEETGRIFSESRARDMRPLRDRDVAIVASTGPVGREASEWWGSSQAALSVAIAARAPDVRIYDPTYNVPVHLLLEANESVRSDAVDPVLIHYHWLLAPERRSSFERILSVLQTRGEFAAWLGERLDERARQ